MPRERRVTSRRMASFDLDSELLANLAGGTFQISAARLAGAAPTPGIESIATRSWLALRNSIDGSAAFNPQQFAV